MQQPSRVQYLYLCLHGRRREVFLKGFEGVISLCFLLEDTSHPLVLLQGRPFTQKDLFDSSLWSLGFISVVQDIPETHFSLGCSRLRKEVLSSHAMLSAASLKAYDGHSSSFGPSATCSRPVLRSSTTAVVTSSFMTPLTTSRRGRGRM